MNKLFLYGLLGALVLSLGLLVACGSSSSSTDDDVTPAGDDDAAPTCQSVYDEFYKSCGFTFQDASGADIAEDGVVADCVANTTGYGLTDPIAQCIINNTGDCAKIESCVQGVIGG